MWALWTSADETLPSTVADIAPRPRAPTTMTREPCASALSLSVHHTGPAVSIASARASSPAAAARRAPS